MSPDSNCIEHLIRSKRNQKIRLVLQITDDMQDASAIKANLAHLLGNSLPLEVVRHAYSDLPSVKCSATPPDFYLRVSERCLGFLCSLARAGSHGLAWAASAAASIKPQLIAPLGTDDLR